MIFTEDSSAEPPVKKIKTEIPDTLVDIPVEFQSLNVLKKEKNTLKAIIEQHNFLQDSHATYRKIDAFFKDYISCWEDFSVKEIENFVENDLTTILNQHSVRQYLKHNVESYCHFLASILDKLKRLDCIFKFLNNETVFHKPLVLENDFQKHFLNIIFPNIIDVLIKYEDNKLFSLICSAFYKCVLNKSSREFEIYLNEIFILSENKINKHNICKFIFKTLKSYNTESRGRNYVYKILFHSLCSSYNFTIVYEFLIISLELLGFNLSRDFGGHKCEKYINSELNLSESLNILADILYVLKNNKTNLSCSVLDINFGQFLENILTTIFNLTIAPNADCYKILQYAIEIHPLLVEKKLNNLIVYSMLSNNTNCSEDYADFLLQILETFAKLHRIQNFVSKMLQILKNSIETCPDFEEFYSFRGNNDFKTDVVKQLDVDKCLPEKVLNFFTECVVQMASWQVMNLFKTFLFHLDSTVTDFINSNGENNSFLELLCKFSSWLLKSIRMAENTVTDTVKENFKSGMNEFRNILSKLGEALLKLEHNEILVGAFLNLSHDWSELSMIFHYYNKNHEVESLNIHSFLSTDQWFSLTQRITNFGELRCKNSMLKLLVQKMRISYIFDNDIDENTQRDIFQHMSLNLKNNYMFIISEKFLTEHMLENIDSDTIMSMCEYILSNAEIEARIPDEIKNSKIFSNGLIYTIFSKIAKVFKKTKIMFVKLFSNMDKDVFIEKIEDEACLVNLKNTFEENLNEKQENLKNTCRNKIEIYLDLLKQLPLPYVSTKIQSLVTFCLFSLHKNFCNDDELRNILEEMIIGIIQVGKINLMDLFLPESLMRNITTNFEKKEKLILLLAENVMTSEASLKSFIPGVNYLLENHKKSDNLSYSIIILNEMQKMKRSKKELKPLCKEIKDLITSKHLEIITNEAVDIKLIQSLVCCLKYNGNFEKLTENYLDLIFNTNFNAIPKGCTSLFAIVLHNKQILDSNSNVPLKIWEFCKTKDVLQDDIQEFSQVLCLVFEHIQNDDFKNVADDLLSSTEDKLDKTDYPEISKYLERWSNIVSSSFNPVKTKILSDVLEKFLSKLHIFKNRIDFQREIFDEIARFEIAIVQQSRLLLSPTILGVLLMSPIVLLRKSAEFAYKFNKCTDLLEQLLKHRSSLIMDRLSPYLKIFRFLLENLCENCNEEEECNGLNDCAHQLEKFIKHLVMHNKHISRIAPHLIADVLQQYEKSTLNRKIKVHLNNCIYSLIPLCDNHSISYLLRVLSTASRELFKIMYDNYKKFYRFTGKV